MSIFEIKNFTDFVPKEWQFRRFDLASPQSRSSSTLAARSSDAVRRTSAGPISASPETEIVLRRFGEVSVSGCKPNPLASCCSGRDFCTKF